MRLKRTLSLAMCLLLALSLTACDVRQTAEDLIIKTAIKLGLRSEDLSDEEEVPETTASAGGSVTFPEGFDPTEERLTSILQDGTLYVGFNGITNRSTGYFIATGSNLTINAFCSTDNDNDLEYKIALWQLSEDQTTTSYVMDSTVYYTAAGPNSCYTYTFNGLTPGRRYKINISIDTTYWYLTGGLAVNGVSDEELLTIEDEES